ncbi:serine hydrolase domain-containing protein [Parasulfitobacter algicola]|uniref:Beta-lactamase family protein n=1 Tax=Parasulfitobacter algicola TaxID=2614809 RepID=A0ABX2ITR3_9RHOB|nr:serine hydrolase domain-containing protein [Sulfitobacter algicola]NSX56298.1 beta-lactamase family protein [Sulfitobacter algicola]
MKSVIKGVKICAVLTCISGFLHAETPHDAISRLTDDQPSVIAGLMVTGSEKQTIEIEMSQFHSVDVADPLVDIGSITKFITAVAVLRLVDDGAFALDTPISQLIKNVPTDKQQITVHQLLTHSSGLIETTGSDEEQLDRIAFLDRVMSSKLMHAPGQEYLYSNAGYSLLAALIEVHSGLSYEDYLQRHLLAPNDLPPIGYQSVYDEERSVKSNRSLLTFFQRSGIADASWGGSAPGWNLTGNGGLVTTAEGFLQFWNAFHQGRLVSPELVNLALTPHVDEGDGDTFYGYGLVVQNSPIMGTVYWHDGGNDLFSAEWRHIADRNLTFFVAGLGENAFDGMSRLMTSIQD